MLNLQTYEDFLNEGSGEVFSPKRGKPVIFDPKKHPELAGEMFDLISTAYAEIGGHAKIKTPEDVFSDPDWNYWEGKDLHGTNDFDLVLFGQRTTYGVKFSGVGHDGSDSSKRDYLADTGKDLKRLGFYVEVSGKLAEILMNKYKCPIVTDSEIVMKVLGKPVDWKGSNPDGKSTGNGWYIRNIGGHPHAKILLGRPKL